MTPASPKRELQGLERRGLLACALPRERWWTGFFTARRAGAVAGIAADGALWPVGGVVPAGAVGAAVGSTRAVGGIGLGVALGIGVMTGPVGVAARGSAIAGPAGGLS